MNHKQRLAQWLTPGLESIGEPASTEAGMVSADGTATAALPTPDAAGGEKPEQLQAAEPTTGVEGNPEGGVPAAVGITSIGGDVSAAPASPAPVSVELEPALGEGNGEVKDLAPADAVLSDANPLGAQSTSVGNESVPEDGTAVVAPGAASPAPVSVEIESTLPAKDPTPEVELTNEVPTTPAVDTTIIASNLADVNDDIVSFADTAVALEQYREIMHSSLAGGGLADPTVRAIRIGLKALDVRFSGSKVVPGIEQFGKSASRLTSTARGLESMAEAQAEVEQVTVNAIATARDQTCTLKESAEGDIASLLVLIDQLENRAGALTEIEFDTTVNLPSPQLFVEGAFVGNDPRAVGDIKEIAEFFAESYPKQALNIAKTLANAIEDYRKSAEGDKAEAGQATLLTVLTALGKSAFSKLPDTQEQSEQDGDSAMLIPLDVSKTLAGDFALTRSRLELDCIEGLDLQTACTHLVDSYQVSFERVAGNDQAAGGAYRLPSVADIKAVLKAVKQTLGVVTKVVKGLDSLCEVIDALQDTVSDTAALVAAGETSGGFAGAVIRARASSALAAPHVAFVGYAVTALREFVYVAQHNIGMYEQRMVEQANAE